MGADPGVLARDAAKMRGSGPVVFTQVTKGVGVDELAKRVPGAWAEATKR